MKRHFPTICVDNFFDDALSVRRLALSQDFSSSIDGTYPGRRTESLHLIIPDFFNFFTKRLFGIFYDYKSKDVQWRVSSNFQLIDANADLDLNTGWVHLDNNSVFAGIVYLNDVVNFNAGTIICDLKDNKFFDDSQNLKHKYYKGETVNKELYVAEMNRNNSKFVDSIEFKNKFNRLVAFDGTTFHRVKNFEVGIEPRLTLVFFVHEIIADWYPLQIINQE